MIKLTQEKDADGERVIIDKALVLQAYSVATAEVPSMPHRAIGVVLNTWV